MMGKQRMVARKWKTYETEVAAYHKAFRGRARLRCPDLNSVRSLKLDDPFWDTGDLTHPNEPWAVDPDTKLGMQAFLTSQNSEEELRRMAREVRQMIQSALDMGDKIDSILGISELCE